MKAIKICMMTLLAFVLCNGFAYASQSQSFGAEAKYSTRAHIATGGGGGSGGWSGSWGGSAISIGRVEGFRANLIGGNTERKLVAINNNERESGGSSNAGRENNDGCRGRCQP